MLKFFLRKKGIVLLTIAAVLAGAGVRQAMEKRDAFSKIDGKYIAVIIDDYGNQGSAGTEEMLELGIPLTAAVMPGLSESLRDADIYHGQGHDVILHQPMEPKRGNDAWLGPFAIKKGMTAAEAKENMEKGLASVQYAVGINNHMGSRVMEDETLVRAVMGTAKENRLIFINSVTTGDRTARKIAAELALPYFERDYFLDDIKSVANTKKQLANAAEKAEQTGYAVVIGHVGNAGGKTTLAGLREMIPVLEAQGCEFVTITQLHSILMNESIFMD